MNTQSILRALADSGIISSPQSSVIEKFETEKPFSIHWELRSILYLGIILFGGGIGVIIYENIDTIGHQAIIATIACVTIYCFYHTYKNRLPYTNSEVKNPNKFSEYTLLLGCTTFLALEGYMQFQYQTFGARYGLAVLIPTIIFFFCAYRFDHRGVLSLAITGLASWLGLTIAPMSILADNDFTDIRIIVLSIMLGILLVALGWVSGKYRIKRHFSFTFLFMGGNLACLAALTGQFTHDYKVIYFIIAAGLCYFFILRSREEHSLIFLLMGVIYGYVIITYALFTTFGDTAAALLATYYFLFSSVGVIIFLLNVKKFLGIKK